MDKDSPVNDTNHFDDHVSQDAVTHSRKSLTALRLLLTAQMAFTSLFIPVYAGIECVKNGNEMHITGTGLFTLTAPEQTVLLKQGTLLEKGRSLHPGWSIPMLEPVSLKVYAIRLTKKTRDTVIIEFEDATHATCNPTDVSAATGLGSNADQRDIDPSNIRRGAYWTEGPYHRG